jgi:hypothetical protein
MKACYCRYFKKLLSEDSKRKLLWETFSAVGNKRSRTVLFHSLIFNQFLVHTICKGRLYDYGERISRQSFKRDAGNVSKEPAANMVCVTFLVICYLSAQQAHALEFRSPLSRSSPTDASSRTSLDLRRKCMKTKEIILQYIRL